MTATIAKEYAIRLTVLVEADDDGNVTLDDVIISFDNLPYDVEKTYGLPQLIRYLEELLKTSMKYRVENQVAKELAEQAIRK